MALFSAVITALEETVAPAMVSTGLPAETGSAAFQPIKPDQKLSSPVLEPMPVVWVEASTLSRAMAPVVSKLTKTVTSLPL